MKSLAINTGIFLVSFSSYEILLTIYIFTVCCLMIKERIESSQDDMFEESQLKRICFHFHCDWFGDTYEFSVDGTHDEQNDSDGSSNESQSLLA